MTLIWTTLIVTVESVSVARKPFSKNTQWIFMNIMTLGTIKGTGHISWIIFAHKTTRFTCWVAVRRHRYISAFSMSRSRMAQITDIFHHGNWWPIHLVVSMPWLLKGYDPRNNARPSLGVILAYVLCFKCRIELVIYVTADGNIVINWAAL